MHFSPALTLHQQYFAASRKCFFNSSSVVSSASDSLLSLLVYSARLKSEVRLIGTKTLEVTRLIGYAGEERNELNQGSERHLTFFISDEAPKSEWPISSILSKWTFKTYTDLSIHSFHERNDYGMHRKVVNSRRGPGRTHVTWLSDGAI